MRWFKSLKEDRIKLQLEQEQLVLYKSELAAREAAVAEREQTVAKKESELVHKEAAVAERERNVSFQDDRWKKVDQIAQWASFRLRSADERERDLARQELDLEQREHLLHRDMEAIIDYRVDSQLAEYIRNKEKGLKEREWIVNRQSRNYVYRLSKCDEREKEMYQRAVLIADHLGVSLNCILTPREKKLVDQQANELTEEHYALIDLVMSCPENQLKDMLASMQRFDQSWPGSPPPPPESEN